MQEAANELGLDWRDLRWQQTGTRAVSIIRRGDKTRKSLMTISANSNSHLWASWQTALANLQTRKANGQKRVNHAEIPAGRIN